MQNSSLFLEYSPWFVLLCIIAGALYAVILYAKKGPWGKKTRYVLAGLRFVLVALLCFLLLSPFLKQIRNRIERPTFVFAIDNSLSLALVTDSTYLDSKIKELGRLQEKLESRDYKVEVVTLSGQASGEAEKSVNFDERSTNLHAPLASIQSAYEGRNLAGVVLFSDGIYNQGISPAYSSYNFAVHSIGAGDTVPKKDVSLRALYYNKISYQGNQFPLVAEVQHYGFEGSRVNVLVKKEGKLLAQKEALFNAPDQVIQVEFSLDADEKGMQHYLVEVEPLSDEFTTVNNNRPAYIEVIEGKEKILLLAQSPHPDLKAIKSALESNENYEIIMRMAGVMEPQALQNTDTEIYDLVILHQLPSRQQTAQPLVDLYLNQDVPVWYILGSQSNINTFNQNNDLLAIQVLRGNFDKVTPDFNENFSAFTFSPENQQILSSFPPATVPFGNYAFKSGGQVLLYQKVGNITTDNPLLAVSDNQDKKSAVMVGEGLWQWRLDEFARTGKQEAFDELISKLVQYLSAGEDKRKFRVYPVQNEFTDKESVVFETEVYNNIYEEIYNQEIDLKVTAEDGTSSAYNYITSEANSQYRLNDLPEGIYTYTATTTLDGKTETSSGQFSVTSLELEALDLTANHNLLRTVAQQTNGSFHTDENLGQLENKLTENPSQGVIHSQEAFLPIIDLWWVLLIILLLISTEWFVRKYNGAY